MFNVLPNALRALIATFLWSSRDRDAGTPLTFHLRHQHGVANESRVVFANIPQSLSADTYQISTTNVKAFRPESHIAFRNARMRSMRYRETEPLEWWDEDVPGPDVTKRKNLLQLARMTWNSYYAVGDKDWYDFGSAWNTSLPFGWEPDADGLRGHVFVSEDESTVVISVKGTSAGWIAGGGGPTVGKDKRNDNLLFSCCCGRVGATWSTVCDCYSGSYQCDQKCVEKSLIDDGLYYPIGINLYNNVSYMYPNANIWVVGHSLGGGIASLIGVTFGAPVVAFESPGEKMAATRLHLPSPPSTQHITHVYHTADPIPMGACTGVISVCGVGGYALESRCHLGKVILYDTVTKLGWSVNSVNHPIKVVIEKILHEDWDKENGIEVPAVGHEEDCVDCFNWEYGDFKNVTKRRLPLGYS